MDFPAVRRLSKVSAESQSVLASASRTSSGTGDAVRLPVADAFIFMLDVTAAASDGTDTLDVTIQAKIGDVWVDVVAFSQHAGNTATTQYLSKLVASQTQAEVDTGNTLAAGSVRHLIGDLWRAKWSITDGSGSASFTFSVTGLPV